MDEQALNLARTALVLIDLQNSNVTRALTPYTAEQVVGNSVLLAQEMRGRGAMIVYVRVLV
ncbi:MAG: isochorismatase family protein, partial [Telluria sp.]